MGAPGKKFSGRQDMFAQDKDGKHYLWVYTSKTPNEDKILVLDAVPQIEGKGLSDLYKEGLFWWYDNALFYVKVGKTDKDTKIVAINTTSKELVNKHQDALSGLIEGRLRPILRVRKPKG